MLKRKMVIKGMVKTSSPLFLILVILFLVGCKPSLPSSVLPRDKMEEIMYDYHLSKSLASQQVNPGEAERIYQDAVLRKYGITQDEFDESLSYYMRHTEELSKIYANLEDRLRAEAGSLGVSASDLTGMGNMSTTGDTANVWNDSRSLVLIPKASFNQKCFTIKCDTSYHAGDAFRLTFDCNFIYQDGTRNACVLLAITLANDSIISTFTQVSMPCQQMLNLSDFGRIGIKEIRGYFILSKGQSQLESATTLQLMFVNNIQLVRMHTIAPPTTTTNEVDTSKMKQPEISPSPKNSGQLQIEKEPLTLPKDQKPIRIEADKVK